MKTFSSRLVCVAAGLGLVLAAGPMARADISVQSISSFDDITIDPSSGSVSYISALGSSAYAQAGSSTQYGSVDPSTASSTDVPVPGGLATGTGSASVSSLSGSSGATGDILGATDGYDTSTGRGTLSGEFQIVGATGPVSVTISAFVSGGLTLSSDAYGVSGQGETDFSLSVNGTPVLFNDEMLAIGPNQSASTPVSETLTTTMTLTGDTTYWLVAEADAEADVINSSVSSVPEPAEIMLAVEGLAMLAFIAWWKRRRAAKAALLGVAAAGLMLPAHAMYIGSDAPDICKTCGAQPTRQQGGGVSTSLSEGNLREDYPVVTISSGYGPTLSFGLTYNSYMADGSKAQLDTGLGFGWTHSYNSMLFQQRGVMFRLGADGRVTQYTMNYTGTGGTYTSDTGYFETMTMQSDGSFIVTNKYQSWWHYGLVPNSPLLIAGPVYQLLQTGDRNNNVTMFSYDANGLLGSVADPYGRTVMFTYNASNKLASVTDPLGRTTQFQYDAQNRELMQITDPLGRTTSYTYNAQYQMTRQVDPDGRMNFYMYRSLLPYAATDGNGQPWFSMTNPTNWSVNATNLTFTLERQYYPGTTTSTDGNGNAWQYAYDANGYITQMTAPNGAVTRYTYDPANREISSMTDALGHTTTFQYDGNGNRIEMTDALGDVTTYTYDPIFNRMTSMTDPDGRITQWQYDPHGNCIEMIDALGGTQLWSYDARGNVLSHTDQNTNTTTTTYDSFGNPASMTDPLANTTQWQYDAIGNRIQMTDPLGNTTQWQYDARDRLITTTDALGNTSTNAYDGASLRTNMSDALGHTTQWQYDTRDRLITTTDALGNVSSNAYDADNNRISTTDPLGRTTQWQYDSLNRVITETDAIGGTSRNSYDLDGNRISHTDPNGNITLYQYDALNRVVDTTNGLGGVTQYEYSAPGGLPCCSATPGSSLVTGMVDADGNVTYYHYDELNRRVQVVRKNSDTNDVINPTDAVTTTAYDSVGNILRITDPVTNTTTFMYDADNRGIQTVDAAGDITRTYYDAVGNISGVTAPNGNTSTNGYDALDRIITVYDEIGPVRSVAYDAVGNIISSTNGVGYRTTYQYDALNRQIETIDALGLDTTTAYDAVGNVIATTDANGNTTRYVYDGLNRQTSVIDAVGNSTITAYDPDGNRVSMTDADGHTTSYTYDALNRRITETYPDTAPNTLSYTYDAVGNRISRVDQDGRTTTYTYNSLYFMTNRSYSPSGSVDQFTYDLSGRMITANRNGWTDTFTYDGANRLVTNAQNGRTFAYTYNIPGRTQTNGQPSGVVLNYVYDARDRMALLADATLNPPIVTYTYDAANRMLTRTNRNGTTATYTYDADDRILSLDHSNALGLVSGFNYTYDNEGNRLSENQLDNPGASEAYTYDTLNRLSTYDVGVLSGSVVPTPTIAKTYNLDPVGNWSSVVSNSVTETYVYDSANRMIQTNSGVLTYDHAGNLTNDNACAYFYDEENRLVAVERLSDSAIIGQYFYDALGRRIEQLTDPAGIPATNYYYYDRRQMAEVQSGGATIATYTYGRYVDATLTMTRGGQTYYYHQDALFDVSALTDPTGTPVERYTYDAYGEPTVLDGGYHPVAPNAWGTPHSAVTNFYLFTGRQWDEEMGLYYYRARHHDPVLGRFLQRDPLDYVDGMNLYEYAGDNPVNRDDPLGKAWVVISEGTNYAGGFGRTWKSAMDRCDADADKQYRAAAAKCCGSSADEKFPQYSGRCAGGYTGSSPRSFEGGLNAYNCWPRNKEERELPSGFWLVVANPKPWKCLELQCGR